MRIALLADIHGNLPALEAVLRDVKRKHSPDRIISLGDQINLGPSPREVLSLLRENGVTCLHGNHERYVLAAMAGDPSYAGANFESLRFNAGRLTAEQITFDRALRLGPVILTHALPQDDRFPVFDLPLALPRLRKMDFPERTHIICGHGHNPTHIRTGNLTLDSIGSTGCMDDCLPGAASYTVLDIGKDDAGLRPFFAHYDTRAVRPLFKSSGMADFCPIMAHIACLQMERNENFIVSFVEGAAQIAKAKGEPVISRETWAQRDAEFDWPDGIGTAAYFR